MAIFPKPIKFLIFSTTQISILHALLLPRKYTGKLKDHLSQKQKNNCPILKKIPALSTYLYCKQNELYTLQPGKSIIICLLPNSTIIHRLI
jgi:hypothetical protein